jgi:hypothetical protein
MWCDCTPPSSPCERVGTGWGAHEQELSLATRSHAHGEHVVLAGDVVVQAEGGLVQLHAGGVVALRVCVDGKREAQRVARRARRAGAPMPPTSICIRSARGRVNHKGMGFRA